MIIGRSIIEDAITRWNAASSGRRRGVAAVLPDGGPIDEVIEEAIKLVPAGDPALGRLLKSRDRFHRRADSALPLPLSERRGTHSVRAGDCAVPGP
jgi:hypothetical protein